MNRWIKCVCVTFVIVTVLCVMYSYSQEQKNCCLCSSGRYHAPCLIDLNTGSLVELALYVPHKIKAAELAEVQPETSAFSFITLGTASGIKLTGSHRIELDIPDDPLQDAALCRKCRQQLPSGYADRYILADLYDEKMLIPLESNRTLSLRCYQITTVPNLRTSKITATIQGTL